MKELSRCSDLNKVARLVLVRYQNVGEVIKGCLFCGDTYICDTAEAKSFQDGKPVPKGSYRIKMRKLPRVSLGSGYYRKGEDRLYLGLPRQQYSVCCITDDAYKPKRGDIGIGFRYGSLKDIKNNFLNESEACRNLLAKIVRTMDCVIFNIVDADERDAIHLRAVQTVDIVSKGRPPKYLAGMDNPNSLLAWYLKVIASQKDALLEVCKTIVADAYFSKKPFVNGLIDLGFNIISRFRSDVRLRYLYDGPKTGKRGRPKVYGDRVDIRNLDMNAFVSEDITSDDKVVTLYSAVVWSAGLKRKVKVVIVDCLEPGRKTQERKVFFSTDTSMSARDIMDIYRTRFQIEYLYRDAKQFTGLAHCQSRKRESLDFAFNMSLSSVNVARAFARSCGVHLSVSNVKTLIHNADMIQRFIRMSGKHPHRLLNANDFKELLYYGVSDAA